MSRKKWAAELDANGMPVGVSYWKHPCGCVDQLDWRNYPPGVIADRTECGTDDCAKPVMPDAALYYPPAEPARHPRGGNR